MNTPITDLLVTIAVFGLFMAANAWLCRRIDRHNPTNKKADAHQHRP